MSKAILCMKTEKINQEKIVILEKTQNHLGEADSIKALKINLCPTIVFLWWILSCSFLPFCPANLASKVKMNSPLLVKRSFSSFLLPLIFAHVFIPFLVYHRSLPSTLNLSPCLL